MSLKFGLANLGYKSYAEYLASPSWADFKYRYRRSGRPQECTICQSERYELHHVTYCRIGRELLDDVMPLCRECHYEVHRVLSELGRSVNSTPRAIRIIKGKKAADKPKKPRRPKAGKADGHGSKMKGSQRKKKRFKGAAGLVARGMPSLKCIKLKSAHLKAKEEAAAALEEYRRSRGIPIRK